jgi:hypothetical protein
LLGWSAQVFLETFLSPSSIIEMGLDGWAITSAVGSVVAAGGVVWERVHWIRTRPRADVRVWLHKSNPMAGFSQGDYMCMVKNFGTKDALDVHVTGVHCEVHQNLRAPNRVEPQSTFTFTLDVDKDDMQRAWLLLAWSTPTSATHRRAAWFPCLKMAD